MKMGVVFFGLAAAGFAVVKFMSADVNNQLNAPKLLISAKVTDIHTMCYLRGQDGNGVSAIFDCDEAESIKREKGAQVESGPALTYEYKLDGRAERFRKHIILDSMKTTRQFRIGDTVPIQVRRDKPYLSKPDYSRI